VEGVVGFERKGQGQKIEVVQFCTTFFCEKNWWWVKSVDTLHEKNLKP